jgi:hypothetical protein
VIEPDADEDPTRVCVKCEQRPRWSRHGRCRYCLQCNPKSALASLRVRKHGPAVKPDTPYKQACRARYALLVAAGATPQQASAVCGRIRGTDRFLAQARGNAAVLRDMERKTTPAPYACATTPAPASTRAIALGLAHEHAAALRAAPVSPALAALAAERDAVELEVDAMFAESV